ncbi:MAG: tripartite tricarboxylate transporter substrate binding protein [Proteobacteria bacterium]|nr:tripartite tricarboxylate transporter substrate binding protein [Burkholderiales bacterium]
MNNLLSKVTMSVLALGALPALAQSDKAYPDRPVRLVVPWAAGGNIDVLTRVAGQKLAQLYGQAFIVDNRGGANGMIGTEMVVRAAADGYTLVVDGLQTHAINPYIFSKMPYDTLRDLVPITLLGQVQHILVVHSSLPVRTTRDLVALAKTRPGEIAYATFGTGSMPHMAGELFQQMTGTALVAVPYKGGAPALTGVLSGETQLYWPGIAIAMPLIRAGKLRALGVASKTRAEELPDLPTLGEQLKAPDYEVTSIFAFMAPTGTPRPVIDKLHAGIVQVLAQADVRKTFATLGAASPLPLSPEDTLALLRAESMRWGKVLRAANIKSN